MRKIFIVLLAAMSLCVCAPAQSVAPLSAGTASTPAPPVPNALIHRIAVQTLVDMPGDLPAREAEVREWLLSMGGNNFFKNYEDRFDPPADPLKHYVVETGDVSSSQLGFYYIHQPATSGDTLTAYPCDPPNARSSPTIRGLCALANWNAYTLTHEPKYRDAFMNGAQWFLQNNEDGRWVWHEAVPARHLNPPWISGLTQSVGISVLLRAYQNTSDDTYLNVAKQAFSWIARPIEGGGLTSAAKGGKWIEEYPDANKPSHVLNGDIWALFGVWDYYRVTEDQRALRLFKANLAAIKTALPWFDTGYWMVYDHSNRVDMVIGLYMQFIVQQFYALYEISKDPVFLETAKRLKNYQSSDTLFVHTAATNFVDAKHTQESAVSNSDSGQKD